MRIGHWRLFDHIRPLGQLPPSGSPSPLVKMAINVHLRGKVHDFFKKHLNFFRVHLLFFTVTPFIFSGIFYAANGSANVNANSPETAAGYEKVEYIDSLFLCFSAMT